MKAVIMAGGEGTRLRPLSLGMPKPMVPLLGRPVMEHIIGLLKRHGVHAMKGSGLGCLSIIKVIGELASIKPLLLLNSP